MPPGVLVPIDLGRERNCTPPRIERGHQVDQILHAPAELVQFLYHHCVALAHGFELGTVGLSTGDHISEDLVTPRLH